MVITAEPLQQSPICLVMKFREIGHSILCPCNSTGLGGTYISHNFLVDSIPAFNYIAS